MSDKPLTYTEFFGAAREGLKLGPDRHPKWQRVEPGTVIPAGQPYRTESRSGLFIDGATSCEFANGQPEPLKVDSLYDGAEYTMRVDSSWKPPHPCNAPLNIKGEGFNCDKGWGHALPHGNTQAGAIWDGEQPPTDSPEPTR